MILGISHKLHWVRKFKTYNLDIYTPPTHFQKFIFYTHMTSTQLNIIFPFKSFRGLHLTSVRKDTNWPTQQIGNYSHRHHFCVVSLVTRGTFQWRHEDCISYLQLSNNIFTNLIQNYSQMSLGYYIIHLHFITWSIIKNK